MKRSIEPDISRQKRIILLAISVPLPRATPIASIAFLTSSSKKSASRDPKIETTAIWPRKSGDDIEDAQLPAACRLVKLKKSVDQRSFGLVGATVGNRGCLGLLLFTARACRPSHEWMRHARLRLTAKHCVSRDDAVSGSRNGGADEPARVGGLSAACLCVSVPSGSRSLAGESPADGRPAAR